MSHTPYYTAEAVTGPDGLTDVRIHINNKTWHLWGRNGVAREQDLASRVPAGSLPVMLGSGLGHCLKTLIENGQPIAVVDMEKSIAATTGVREQYADHASILWLDDTDPQTCLDKLTQWQKEHENKPFTTVPLPLYLRLNRPHYGALAETLKANAQTDFWSQAHYPKFQSSKPRVLFFDSNYFLCGEIRAALESLAIEYQTIELGKSDKGSQEFIETLLSTVIDFKPDFILTVNHFGLDREGKLSQLLDNLKLPLASWFVDNPHLILHQYAHPGTDNTVIFTYDAGNLAPMRERGFKNVHHLPLATDPQRFKPGLKAGPTTWNSDISFVGNSMINPVAKCLGNAGLPAPFVNSYEEMANKFSQSGETSVTSFFQNHAPEWNQLHQTLPTTENQLALESLITWEATRQYRLSCVSQTLPFAPLIVGDQGWYDQLTPDTGWRHLPGLDYYEELPRFYPASKINFNCTSRQMPGAVNQRVFDVPATGAFLLTDYREQMENLFDLKKEVAVYHTPEEIPALIEKFSRNSLLRDTIASAARARILAEHTYEIRLKRMLTIMRESF